MNLTCPSCRSSFIKKNGSIHSGKQKYACLSCHRQFVENPENKVISEETRGRIQRSLLERVSLEGICRIFDVSMPWLLGFMQKKFQELPEDLNAVITNENENYLIATLEVDEMWGYVGNKKNQQWLWIVMDTKSRQIIAFHVGDRSKKSGEMLMKKLPDEVKKKPSFTQIISQFTMKSSLQDNTIRSEKGLEKRTTLKDLIVRLDSAVQD